MMFTFLYIFHFLQCTEVVYLLNNNKFLQRDTTFTVNITSLHYLGPPDGKLTNSLTKEYVFGGKM